MVHAMIRRYRVDRGKVDEVAHRVDVDFADTLTREPGFVDYQVIDCGDGTIISVTMFETEEGARRSTQLAGEWVEDSLADIRLERTEAFGGEVLVSRAESAVLEPAHH